MEQQSQQTHSIKSLPIEEIESKSLVDVDTNNDYKTAPKFTMHNVSHELSSTAINNKILTIFNEMAEYYETLPGMKHKFQARAYRKVIPTLETYFRNHGNKLITDVDKEVIALSIYC